MVTPEQPFLKNYEMMKMIDYIDANLSASEKLFDLIYESFPKFNESNSTQPTKENLRLFLLGFGELVWQSITDEET